MKASWQEYLVGALLAATVLCQWLSCLGVVRERSVYSRLHYLGPSSFLGGVLIIAATLASGTSSPGPAKAIVLGLLLICTGPVTSHALARAHRVRETGNTESTEEEIQRSRVSPR